jgi:hypothetical protein
MPCNPQTVIKVAESQIGYLEKKSNADLDSFTGNAGSGNYTKYNRDMRTWAKSAGINDQWCQNFVDWCFVRAYGLEAAKKLLGGFTNYTPTGSNYFKSRGAYTKRGKGKPQVGDVIYFYSESKGRIGHVGIVTKVTSTKVYTIEGNTSGASSLVTNGGGVRAKAYSLSSTYIDGYGRPPYASVNPTMDGNTTADKPAEPLKLGDRVLMNGMEGADVKALQSALIKLGYDCGKWGADGEYGDCTELAVRRFQTQEDLTPDGEAGPQTFAALKKALEKLAEPVDKPRYVHIVGGNCYVREEPDITADKRGIAYCEAMLPYGGQTADNGWLSVVYKDRIGWVSGKYGRLVK